MPLTSLLQAVREMKMYMAASSVSGILRPLCLTFPHHFDVPHHLVHCPFEVAQLLEAIDDSDEVMTIHTDR